MRILFILPLFCVAALLLNGCETAGNSDAGMKIAVADVSRLMKDSVPGKEGIKFLESRQAIFQKELDEIQDRLEKNPSDESAMKDLQRVYSASQQQIQAEGQNVATLLFDTLQRVLDTFREQKGYDLILSQDTVASFARSVDITNEVMQILDQEKIEFKPLPAAQPPAEINLPEPASKESGNEPKPEDDSPAQNAQDKK